MRRLSLFVLGLVPVLYTPSSYAEDTATEQLVEAVEPDAAEEIVPVENSDDPRSQDEESFLLKRKLEIGLILTACIFLLGMFLVITTLAYGRRTRRQLAAGRGDSQPRDELWYFKNERQDDSKQDESREETK
ncbi:MAG: hypothetical protein HUJ26_03540 [Planctomycetaceae bacterium]|nr:hypothetical protein [Planctomycetaceae bacterium]